MDLIAGIAGTELNKDVAALRTPDGGCSRPDRAS
jgi:hypothetical protein